jgi:elongation factor Ts
MAEIAASTVMELRQRTGLGMMECKKALTECGGDLAKAEDLLRIKSGAKASKAASRIAAEGAIGLFVAPDAKVGAMVEVNCETDFVAKNEDFRAFVGEIARLVAERAPADAGALSALPLASGETVEARRVALVQKIGENIALRRFVRRDAKGRLASYVHGTKIGVLVDVTGGVELWARTSRCTSRRSSRSRGEVAGARRCDREGTRDRYRAGRRGRQDR